MSKLWHKKDSDSNPAVGAYMISEHLAADKALLPYDCLASQAHAKMLAHVGLITSAEAKALVEALAQIMNEYTAGTFKLGDEHEDCHSAIENYLVEKLGEVGKKIHMGRSRNDQVLVAQRLLIKDKLTVVQKNVIALAEAILAFAKKYEFIPMPGYTHTRQAMLSSVGQWAGAFVESLLDDLKTIKAAQELNDQNPLGSAAGFGTSLPIDREYTTKELGFKRTQVNALYCQNSRGKIESFAVNGLTQVMLTLGRLANDLIWFTTEEFGFFSIDKSLTTGSSIMPQKQNLDIMEVLRANVAVVISNGLQIQMASHNLISGYNKDLKITKQPTIESLDITVDSLAITKLVFENLTPNESRLSKSFKPEIFSTDKVNELVKDGKPFRDAYRLVGEHLDEVKVQDPIKNLKAKTHLGAPGNLSLDSYSERLRSKD